MKSESARNINDDIQHVFDQRALQYAKENSKNNKQHNQSYILFKLQNEHFGISLYDCHRVLNRQKITSIPFAPSYIKGVLHYCGRLIATIDLLEFFGYAETTIFPDQSVIVIQDGNTQFCILADQIIGLGKYSEKELSSTLSDEFTKNKKYILGIQNGSVAIINTKVVIDELIISKKTMEKKSGVDYERKQ